MGKSENTMEFSIDVEIKSAIGKIKEFSQVIKDALNIETSDAGLKDSVNKFKIYTKDISKEATKLQNILVDERTPEYIKKVGLEILDLTNQIREAGEAGKSTVDLESKLKGRNRLLSSYVGKGYDKTGVSEALSQFLALYDDVEGKARGLLSINDANLQIEKQEAEEAERAAKAKQDEANAAAQQANSEGMTNAEAKNAEETAKKQKDYQEQIGAEIDKNTQKQEEFTDAEKKGAEAAKQFAEEFSNAVKDTKTANIAVDLDADTSKMGIAELTRYLEQLKLKVKEIKASWKETNFQSDSRDAEFEKTTNKINEAKQAIKDYGKEAEDANNKLSNAQVLNTINGTIQGIASAKTMLQGALNVINAIGPAAQTAGLISEVALTEATAGLNLVITIIAQVVNAIQNIGNVLQAIWSKAKQVFTAIYDAVKKVIKAIGDLISKIRTGLRKALDSVGDSADKAFSVKNLRRTLQMLTKYIFGVRSFFFLYRKLRSGVTEGLKNLVQFESASNETNHAITELRSSLLYLKNAWAAAFAPIINFVYPVLVRLMDMLASVGNAIARFIGAFTGASTVLQAVKVDAGDYADSLKSAGGSAKKAADEQKKLNDRLAAFDDLNVLGRDKDDEDTSPSGGSGGSPDDLLDSNSMFERVNVKMTSLMQKIREAWQTGDGFELGQTIAEAINRGLENAHTWLTGEGRDKIQKIVNLIGTTLDGMLSDSNLASNLGQVLADLFSDAMLFINTVITSERMYMIGVRFAQVFNTAIPQILPELGETIGNLFKSAISNAWGFISTADFAEWGAAFGDAINNFMTQMSGDGGKGGKDTLSGWQLLGMSVTEWAKQILNFFIEAIEKVDWKEIGVAIREFLENIDWNSIKESLKKLWEGVWKALGEVFPENQDLLNSVKKIFEGVFDVVSKATKALADIDWTPITNAISGLIEKISKADWDKIGGAISDLITTLGEKLPDIVDFISNISSKFGDLIDGIEEFLASDDFVLTIISIRDELERTATAIENIIGFASSLQGLFDTLRGGGKGDFSFFDALKMFANIGWGSIASEFGPVINGITAFRNFFNNFDGKIDAFSSFVDSISDKLDELGINFSSVLDVLLSVWGSMSNGFGGLIQDFILGQVNLSAVFDVISGDFDVWSVIKDGFVKFVGELIVKIDDLVERFTGIPNALSGLVGSFRRIFNNIINLINDFFSRVTEGRNELVNILGSMGGISGAAAAFASSGAISFTPIPRLAQGAVIPPNKQFMAVLGDQTSGTNIEAPLDTIRQAVGEEFAPYFEQMIQATMQVVQAVNSKNLVIGDREIGKANARYLNQQKEIRGTML